MRRVLMASMAAAALAGCQDRETAKTGEAAPAAGAETAASQTPPDRKPGLWKQTVTAADMTQASEICLDAAVDRRLTLFGQPGGEDRCQTSRTRTADGWRFESVCDMGSGGKVVSSGVARGDFGSAYVVEATTTTTGAAAPQMNGTHEMKLDAAWQGPCPEGMAPGDMRLPGGVTVNLLQMAE